MMFRIARTLLVVFTVLFGSASIAYSDSEAPIKLGALMPLTGDLAMLGSAYREGAELAVDEINRAGGVSGRNIKLIIEDTRNDPQKANTAAQKLTSVDKVVAAITCTYPETVVGGKLFERNRIPTIAIGDASPEIESIGDYVFSIGIWTPSAGEESARFAAESLRSQKAVIVHTVEEWSESVSQYFADSFRDKKKSVLKRFSVNPGDSDFRTVVTKIKELRPDVIYAPLTEGVVAFHRQLREQAVSAPVISSDIIADEHISLAPKVFEGVYQSNMLDPSHDEAQHLFKLYKKKFGKDATLPWFTATGYDAVRLIAGSIDSGEISTEGIKEALYKTRDFPGASQRITFNSKGSSPGFERVFQVVRGKFTPVG